MTKEEVISDAEAGLPRTSEYEHEKILIEVFEPEIPKGTTPTKKPHRVWFEKDHSGDKPVWKLSNCVMR